MANVRMFAPSGFGGSVVTAFSGVVFVQSDGTVTVNAQDVPNLLGAGFEFAISDHRMTTIVTPVAQSNSVIFGSVALANGSVTITNQPDVPRQITAIIAASGGTSVSIGAGVLTLNYAATDGTTQTDALSLVTPTSTGGGTTTVYSSKGVEYLNSAVVTGLVGAAATILGGTTNFLGVPVAARSVDFTVTAGKKMNVSLANSGLDLGANPGSIYAGSTTGFLWQPPAQWAPGGSLTYMIAHSQTYPG